VGVTARRDRVGAAGRRIDERHRRPVREVAHGVDVHGTAATATMTLAHGADTFTDVSLPARVDDSRRIANKAYQRHG
jgi:hypothetical protein